MPPKKRKSTKVLSLAQVRSQAINGVIFVLRGLVANIEIQSSNKLPISFPATRGYLAEAVRNLKSAIKSIKRER